MRKMVTFFVAAGVLGLMGCTQPKATTSTNRPRAVEPTPTVPDLTPRGTPTVTPLPTAPPTKTEATPPKTDPTPPTEAPPKKPG